MSTALKKICSEGIQVGPITLTPCCENCYDVLESAHLVVTCALCQLARFCSRKCYVDDLNHLKACEKLSSLTQQIDSSTLLTSDVFKKCLSLSSSYIRIGASQVTICQTSSQKSGFTQERINQLVERNKKKSVVVINLSSLNQESVVVLSAQVKSSWF